MTICRELEATILRYYHVEDWRIGTIARQLHLHYDTVARVVAQAGVPTPAKVVRPSQIDPYLPFVRETLEQFPELTASRLYVMVKERGYPGRPDHFRHLIARHRPRPRAEAYLRLRTLKAEQAQADWGHFGSLTIGRARRTLMAFVMVLSYSRRIYLHFFLGAKMENFLRGHVGAFSAWQGVPRVVLYDNLKSAVLERQGKAIRFHPTLIELTTHYRFEPRPVAVARGNEKGRVERAIRYIRENFFAARKFSDLDDLNRQADYWCNGIAADRRCPDQTTMSVREAFAEEQPTLLKLPEAEFSVFECVPASVGKTPYIRFDLNDYSVPHTHVRRPLTVLADLHQVRVVDGSDVIVSHPRSYDRGAQIEDPQHIEDLTQYKRDGQRHVVSNQLALAAPASQALILRAAENRDNLGAITAALKRLLDRYGSVELQAAIAEALECNSPHPKTVGLILERRRELRNQPPPVSMTLSAQALAKDVTLQPQNLNVYDQLKERSDDE